MTHSWIETADTGKEAVEAPRREAPAARALVLQLQRSAGNAAVTRQLQRYDWWKKQRSAASGRDAEDVDAERRRLGPIGHVGADATREAQSLHPAPLKTSERAALTSVLESKHGLPQSQIPDDPIGRPGAAATREAQALGPVHVNAASIGHAEDVKHRLGPVDRNLRGTRNAFIRNDRARRRRAEQEQRPGRKSPEELAEHQEARRANLPSTLEADRQNQLAANDVRARAESTAKRIAAAPEEIRSKLDPSISERVAKAGTATPEDHAACKQELDAVLLALQTTKDKVLFDAKHDVKEGRKRLAAGGLAQALCYQAPELAKLNAAIDGATAEERWLDAIPKIFDLEALLKPCTQPLATIASVIKRVEFAKAEDRWGSVDPAALSALETRLAARHATPIAALPALAGSLEQQMLAAEQPLADKLFKFSLSISPNYATDALGRMFKSGTVRITKVTSTYPNQSDGTSGYGASLAVAGIQSVVIHVHLSAAGALKKSHWKRAKTAGQNAPIYDLPPEAKAHVEAMLPAVRLHAADNRSLRMNTTKR